MRRKTNANRLVMVAVYTAAEICTMVNKGIMTPGTKLVTFETLKAKHK